MGGEEAGHAGVAATEQLSQLIRAEHLAFATTGDPGWAQFRTTLRMTRVYSPEAVLITYPEERSRELWSDQQFGVLSVTT
jgi:para-nitrobenzyl esterase